MSVYIKGMEMPKNCWECNFGHCWEYQFGHHGETGVCVVDFKGHGDWDEPKDCPLVPVPPHGDLIDRDALPTSRVEWEDIVNAPAIIPAEEGE